MHDIEKATDSGSHASAASGRMVGLDSLRGIAILAVIAFHVGIHFPPGGAIGSIASLGYTGVQLFFIVSAVSMCFMWDQRRGERAPVRSFLIRRLCRIAPPFWFGIAFYMMWRQCGFLAESPVGPVDIAITAGFLHGFFPSTINLVVPGGWSIAVEVGFYILFPLLVTRIGGVKMRIVCGLLCYLVCTAIASVVRMEAGPAVELFLYYSLLTQLPIFIVGMVVYSLSVKREPLPRATTAIVLLAWIAIAEVARARGWLGRPGLWGEVALLAAFSGIVIGRFESRFLAFAGRFSYSAYLFHFAVLDLIGLCVPEPMHHGLGAFTSALIATCLGTGIVAWISSKTLESWSIAYGRSLVRRVNGVRIELSDQAP